MMLNPFFYLLEYEPLKELFLQLVNTSISAGWLILAVLALRAVMNPSPRWAHVLLWGIVGVRLLCPISIEFPLSLIPSTETVPLNIEMAANPAIDSGIGVVDRVINPVIAASFTPDPMTSMNPLQLWVPLSAVVWLLGVIIIGIYTAVSYLKLRHHVAEAVLYRDNIFQSERIDSPFVLGILRPRIYLPFRIAEEELPHIIAHEQAHIRRKDHWWKPLGFLLLTLHWFNPLMWVAYILLCRDIELACDERVIKELGHEQRADYTQTLLSCSVGHRSIAACPLAFGEVGVKQRIKSVMRYKKPAVWAIAITVVLCITVAVCFLTNPVASEQDLSFLNYKNAASIIADADELTAIYCPPSYDNSGASIQVGATTGADLAKQLDRWEWKTCNPPRQSLPSPGSVEFIIDDDYRITVHQRKPGSLRQYAVVQYQNEVRYYRIDKSDYPDAVALVHAPGKNAQTEAVGKTYVYEKDGFYGDFQITLYDDGTFTYYEGLASSYLGIGTWNQEGNIITLKDDEAVGYAFVNHFRLDGDDLVFIEQDSSNFIYVKLTDGEHFTPRGEAFKLHDNEVDSTAAESWDMIPMVMVNGVLYLDTGKESPLQARCGVMDGEITSSVDGGRPTQNNQSNFGTGYGYQYGTIEGTIDILMNDKWWIYATEEARHRLQFPTDGSDLLETFRSSLDADKTTLVTDYVYAEDGVYGLKGVVQYADETGSPWKLAFILDDFAYPVSQDWGGEYAIASRLSYLGGGKVKVYVEHITEGTFYECTMTYSYDEAAKQTDFISESHEVTPMDDQWDEIFLHMGLNAEIIDIDEEAQILYVKDIDPSAKIFGERCGLVCTDAAARYNLLYVKYEEEGDVRTIDFSEFMVGDQIIVTLPGPDTEAAFNGMVFPYQVQLGTQRIK